MTNFLLRFLIRPGEEAASPQVRNRCGRLAGLVRICCNLLLGGGKMAAGLVFSSISVLADGVNNLSDAVSSGVTLICFKMSSRPADREHPFGHARMEYVAGLVVSVLILLVGFELAGSSFEKILQPEEVPFRWLTAILLAVSAGVKLWMALFNRKISRLIGSSALEATAQDSRNDVIATSAVLLSMAVSKLTSLRLDGWMGLAIALFILWSGVSLIKETLSPLLGEAPDPELVRETMKRLRAYDGVLGIHDLMVHDYGPGRRFASVHVEVDAQEDIMASHDLCDIIERDFAAGGMNLVVHMDPIVVGDPELDALRGKVLQIVSELAQGAALHDFRMVKGRAHTNLIFDVVVPAGCSQSNDSLLADIQRQVSALDPDTRIYTIVNIDRNYISNP